MMTIAIDRKDSLKMMVDAFKFLENQAGNAGVMAKQKNTMDESRTDEVDVADVISSVRLLYKALIKKEEKDKKNKKRWFNSLTYIDNINLIHIEMLNS